MKLGVGDKTMFLPLKIAGFSYIWGIYVLFTPRYKRSSIGARKSLWYSAKHVTCKGWSIIKKKKTIFYLKKPTTIDLLRLNTTSEAIFL